MQKHVQSQNEILNSTRLETRFIEVISGEILAEKYQLLKRLHSQSDREYWLGIDLENSNQTFIIRHKRNLSSNSEHLFDSVNKVVGLRNQRITKILATHATSDSVWLINDAPKGENLTTYFEGEKLPIIKVLTIFREILLALESLHKVNAYHKSLNPDFIFLEEQSCSIGCEILWTGNDVHKDANALLTQANLRELNHLSPEQLGLVEERIGHCTDIYSAASIIYQLSTRQPPFQANHLNDLLYLHSTQTPRSIRESGIDCPIQFDEIIQRCLQHCPRDRYQSVLAIRLDIESLLDNLAKNSNRTSFTIGAKDVRGTLVPPAFCARQAEYKAFELALNHLLEGKHQDIHIEGISGLGKSRLITEFKKCANSHGILTFHGTAKIDLGSPFQILDNITSQIIQLVSRNPSFNTNIVERCNEYTEILLNAFPTLINLFPESVSEREFHSIGEASTLRAICLLLDSLGCQEAPAVVILDDVQWDLEFVTRLLKMWKVHRSENSQRKNFTMLLISYRSDEVVENHPIRKISNSKIVQLKPFTKREIRQLSLSMAGPLPNEAIHLVEDLSLGSPFIASAILHGLVEAGDLYSTPHGWNIETTQFNQIRASSEAGEILSRRLGFLKEETKNVLEVGAVLGSEFDTKTISTILSLTDEELSPAIQEAKNRQFLWNRRGHSNCQFLHDKIREQLLNQINPNEKQKLHKKIVHALSIHSPEKFAELAYHSELACEYEQAYKYAVVSGQDALKRHALKLASKQFEIALRTAQHVPNAELFTVQEGLGQALMLLGKYGASEQVFEEAAKSVQTLHQEAEIRGKQGELCIKRGDMDSAVSHFENALGLLKFRIPNSKLSLFFQLIKECLTQTVHSFVSYPEKNRKKRQISESERLPLKLLSHFSHACWYCRSQSLTLWAHLKGMNRGELYEPSEELAQAYSDHAPAMILIPWFKRAFQYVGRSYDIREKLHHAWGQGQSLHFKAITHYANCEYEQCIDDCRNSIKILERTGDYWQVHIARYQLAAALFRLGNFEDANEECRKNYESGITLGDFQASGIILDIWVQSSYRELDNSLLETEFVRHREDIQGQAQVSLAKAIVLLNKGETHKAIELLEETKRYVKQAGVQNPYTTPVYTWLIAAYRQQSEEDDSISQKLRMQALRDATRLKPRALWVTKKFANELPRLHRELAFIEAMKCRFSKAKKHLKKSLFYANKHNATIEAAKTLVAREKIFSEFQASLSESEMKNIETAKLKLREYTQEKSQIQNKDSISLADQFGTLMETGRDIMSARDVDEITQLGSEAAGRLLRAPQISIHWNPTEKLSENEKLEQQNNSEGEENNLLRCDIIVRSQRVAELVIQHSDRSRVFNYIERQIAAFVASLIGAAVENAEVFKELQKLNDHLESRVTERTEELRDRNDQLSRSNRELETVAKALRRTQSRLVESIRGARQASEAKGRFLAMMSHEIRTPMNGIIGMTQLALQSCEDSQLQSQLTTVAQSAKTLLTILNDVLDFSKIEAGKLAIEKIPFNLHDSVVDASRLLAIKAEEKQLKFRCLISPTVPVNVIGDPNRIRQVLLNLLGNAIKFTSDGSVDVIVEPAPSSEQQDAIRFSVIDTGVGIPEEDVGKVFEAFDQGDASVTRKFGGTGLGLSISRNLVELMGGKMFVESKLDQGSHFSFVLDLKRCEEAAQHLVDKKSILIFCKDDVTNNYLSNFLTHEGHNVDEIESATDLRAKVLEQRSITYDFIIIDVEDIGSIQDELLGTAIDLIPILLLVPTSSRNDPSLQLALNLCSSLTKPFSLNELQSEIAHIKVIGEERNDKKSKLLTKPNPHKSLKLLIIDDSEINLMVAKSMIESFGHDAKIVSNGQEGVERASEDQFDAIFMDIEMPEMDGITATQKIREMESEQNRQFTPIFAMTAHVLDEFKIECKKAGMNGFVSKPIDQNELKDFLDELGIISS